MTEMLPFEEPWRAIVGQRRRGGSPVLSVCGPSGVGKTTAVKALSKCYPTFIETTTGNPHLQSLLEGNIDFNAAANQSWFLERIGLNISRANSNVPLILDQDPAAIVLAYSRMFFDDNKMTDAEYAALIDRLLKIEEKLQVWRCPRTVLFLDAPADVLRQRVLERWGKSRTPPLQWFERVRSHFIRLFTCFPNAITASTVNLSPEQVVARAKSLIENRSGSRTV